MKLELSILEVSDLVVSLDTEINLYKSFRQDDYNTKRITKLESLRLKLDKAATIEARAIDQMVKGLR